MPGATSSVFAPSSDALVYLKRLLIPFAFRFGEALLWARDWSRPDRSKRLFFLLVQLGLKLILLILSEDDGAKKTWRQRDVPLVEDSAVRSPLKMFIFGAPESSGMMLRW